MSNVRRSTAYQTISSRPTLRSLFQRRLQLENLESREVLSAATIWSIAGGVYDLNNTFLLHSTPSAKHTIYLDFDGHTNGNVTGSGWDNLTSPAWDFSGNGAAFSDSEKQIIQKIWARVSEDFAPFNVDVTTQDPGTENLRKFGTGDDRWGIRVVVTPNDTPAPGSGGVAYIGSFNFSDLTPVYVFNSGEKSIAEAASHEVGHSLGLGHDGTATLGYYSGHGSGSTSWGPIMGASYSPNVTQWSKGEYSGANNSEDDLAKITTNNGFTYLSDDYGSTQTASFELLTQGTSQVSGVLGVIERSTDSDWFSFWSDAGAISLNTAPLNIGPNLGVKAELFDNAGTLLTTVNTVGALNAQVNFNLAASGQFFLKITGTGKGDPLTNGFSNYASLGNYRITGSVQPYTGTPPTNTPPVANADSASTVAGTPITIPVLANDSDANGDTLTITGISGATNGTAVVSGSSVIFSPDPGFTGTGSFTYTIDDGHGGTASALVTITVNANNPSPVTTSFLNNTDVTITSSTPVTVTSSTTVSGLSGTVEDLNVTVNVYHTYDQDLQITLISPDGTRVLLFNRHGGSRNNILNTVFDDSASRSIASGSAPFTGTFRPSQALSAFNGKAPNGVWKLEIKDLARLDGGRLDNWTLTFTTPSAPPATATTALGSASSKGLSSVGHLPAGRTTGSNQLSTPATSNRQAGNHMAPARTSTERSLGFVGRLKAAVGKLFKPTQNQRTPELEADLPRARN